MMSLSASALTLLALASSCTAVYVLGPDIPSISPVFLNTTVVGSNDVPLWQVPAVRVVSGIDPDQVGATASIPLKSESFALSCCVVLPSVARARSVVHLTSTCTHGPCPQSAAYQKCSACQSAVQPFFDCSVHTITLQVHLTPFGLGQTLFSWVTGEGQVRR